MSPKMISPIKKIPKKIDRDEFLKPKKINDIKKQQYTYTYLMEQMCDYIRKLDKNVLKQGIRIWTPFTTDQGVLLQEGFGYIIKDEGVMDEHDILIKGGKLSPYDAIAKAMSKHYDKQHLEIIERYLKLKPFPKNQFTLLNFKGKYIIKEFDTFIKKIWPKPPQDLKGKTQQKKERARMALNYFSAILAFGEPYRREGNLTDSLDLISDLIVNYISPTNTPIKAFLCKDGSKQHRLTMTGCSEELRNTKFNDSGIMKKKKKTKIKPRSNSSSSLDDEDEILDGNLKSAESDIIKEAQREDNFDDPEMMPKNQRQKYMPKVPNGDLMEQFSAKKTRRNSIKIQKKEMKEERETSTDSDTDSLEMKMSTKSSRNSSLNNINNNRSMSEEKEISEIKEKESYSENKQTTKSTSPISYMEEEENEIFHSTPSRRPYTLHRIKTTKKKKATKKRKNKP